MTKLKNTKKGMAKKALSISLVAAMLATSNVPVWAADVFDDGNSVAVETEAPAEEETPEIDLFSAEAPAEEAPVVDSALKASTSGDEYTANLTAFTYGGNDVKDNAIVWGEGDIETDLTVSRNAAIDGAALKVAWKVNDEVVSETVAAIPADGKLHCYHGIGAAYANKKIALYVYAQKGDGEIVWSYTSDEITVAAKKVNDIVKATTADVQYDGEINKVDPIITSVDSKTVPTDLDSVDDYTIGYGNSDLINVTGKDITVTLTPKSEAYAGTLTCTYKITEMLLSRNFDSKMKATLKNTSLKYNGGKTLVKVKKSDITLVDKATNVDLSNYLAVDENGFVNVSIASNSECWVSLANGIPSTGTYKNYNITPANEADRRIKASNVLEIEARDLSTVNITIDRKRAGTTKVNLVEADVHFTDKETHETLELWDDVDVTVPNDAIKYGTYNVSIAPKSGNTNVTGSATATLYIYASDINDATFGTHESSGKIVGIDKYYTGEEVTFSEAEIGVPVLKDEKNNLIPLKADDYSITYTNNTNAGKSATMFVVGEGSYANSLKKLTFEIKKTPVSSVTANDYVEKIDTDKPESYKEAMGLVVKAKVPNTNKELTLKEGTDYTVQYAFDSGKTAVTATVTIKGNSNFNNGKNITLTATSTLAKATLKSEYIKLKENSFTYNGQAIEPAFDVVIGGHILPNNGDAYTYAYTNNVDAGTATLTIKGAGDYQGTASLNFTIQSADAAKLNGVVGTKEYKGYSIEIPADEIDLTLNGKVIDVSKNFTLTYGENVNIGEGTVTLTPKNNNFTGTKTINFQIIGEMLKSGGTFKYVDSNGFEVIASKKKFNYSGNAQTFAKTSLSYTDKKLTEGTDYEIKYVDNVYGQKGTDGKQYAAVLAVAKGKYGGNQTISNQGIAVKDGIYTDAEGNKTVNVFAMDLIEIVQQEINMSNVSVSNGTYAAGLPVKPAVSIVVKGVKLVEGKDYDLNVTKNKDVINSTEKKSLNVVIEPKNGYKAGDISGKEFSWGIDKFNFANAVVTVDGDKVTVKCGSVDVPASEYTITKDAAADTVTVEATKDNKNYTGSKTVNATVIDPEEKPVAPTIQQVNVVGNKATVVLEGNTEGSTGYDYVISKSKVFSDKASRVGVNANVLSTQTTFRYVDQGVYYAYLHSWKRGADGKKIFSAWSNAYPFVVSSITPDQPTVTSVKVTGKTVKVTYTKAANATGYDLVLGSKVKKVYGEKRPVEYGKLVKKVYKGNTVTATFTNVPKGTYYAGLHAYNRTSENNGKVFSPWSNTKKVTVK